MNSAFSTALLLTLSLTACTHLTARQRRTESKLAEESRVLTTAVVDTLDAQPDRERSAFTDTALRLARQDQRLEGLPTHLLDVAPLIHEAAAVRVETAGTNPPTTPPPPGPATIALKTRFAAQDALLADSQQTRERLVSLGEHAEEERNARIGFWTRLLALGGGSLGAIVLLVVFVPAAMPLLGRFLGWLVSRAPGLAGSVGVVSVRAFDAVVRGIERFKAGTGAAAPPADPGTPGSENSASSLLQGLSHELDSDHKDLVKERRAANLKSN